LSVAPNAGIVALGTGTFNLNTTTLVSGTPLVNSGATTLQIASNGTLANYNVVSANAGTLRLNTTSGPDATGAGSGPDTTGGGVPVNNLGGGTLELAGTVSDLSTSTLPVRVHTIDLNNGTQTPDGNLTVTGTNQPIGAIDGTGDTVINSGATLTANHIVQGALTIGGGAGTQAPVTIAASDFSGNPLAASLGVGLTTATPFESSTLSSPSLISTVGSDSSAV